MAGALKAKVNGQWVLASSAAGGGGAEEVYVGPIDPGAAYDLWIDTGTPQTLPQDARWNTAWGEVYYTEFPAAGVNMTTTPAMLIPQIDLTGLAVGRKLQITVWGGAGPTTSVADSELYLAIADTANTVLRRARNFNPTVSTKAGPGVILQHRVNTTASTYSFRVMVYVSTGTGAWFYSSATEPVTVLVEDVGPVAGALISPDPTPIWNPLPFSTGWQNYGAPFYGGSYRRLGDIVYLRGLISQVAGAATWIGTLPVGFRPMGQIIQSNLCSTGQARFDIYTNGQISTSTSLTVGNWVCLDCIDFSVTP